MAVCITSVSVRDIRFPTSDSKHGSDAMHKVPDYSAAYVVITTDAGDGLEGHGLTFTLGSGTEIIVLAVRSLSSLFINRNILDIFANFSSFWREITSESQLRWIGPEKGAIHMAVAALVNSLWDLWAKRENKPVWRLLVDMSPEELVSVIDFRYLSNALTREEALELLRLAEPLKEKRLAELYANGLPAYTTSAGWLGYSDCEIRRLCREALAAGWTCFKIKVGESIADDIRRCRIIREEIGYDHTLMVDANQRWEVNEAINCMQQLAQFKPWFIEEPTSPDDIIGHSTIAEALRPLGILVATGEACQNRTIFKQLMQSNAIGICQVDSCRVGGVNEILAIILMAAKFNIPVCPHAGGVGLCEYVQHLSAWDFISISGPKKDRLVEYVDHLHEHFLEPVVIKNGHYMLPEKPGYSIEMKPKSLALHEYPNGLVWKERIGH